MFSKMKILVMSSVMSPALAVSDTSHKTRSLWDFLFHLTGSVIIYQARGFLLRQSKLQHANKIGDTWDITHIFRTVHNPRDQIITEPEFCYIRL